MTVKVTWQRAVGAAGGLGVLLATATKLEDCAGRFVVLRSDFEAHERAELEARGRLEADFLRSQIEGGK